MIYRESKLGRNDLCWCGSEKKYKDCCLTYEQGPKPSREQITATLEGAYAEAPGSCMHPRAGPECRGGLVRAHSVQKGGGLSKIARAGQVYYFVDRPGNLIGSSGWVSPKLEGFKKASTSRGFCGYHDLTTFLPIEGKKFEPSYEQLFLLAFRSLCRELWAMRRVIRAYPRLRTLLRGQARTTHISFLREWEVRESTLNDLERRKAEYDRRLLESRHSGMHHYVLLTDKVPPVLASALVTPFVDFRGNRVQRITDPAQRRQDVAFSMLACEPYGAVVFSWLSADDPTVGVFIRTLDDLNVDERPDAVLRFAFEFSNNLCISPSWWDQIPLEARRMLEKRAQPLEIRQRPDDCLAVDGVKVANFRIVRTIYLRS